MNASALLDELLAAGIRVGRDGDDLIADVLPAADFAPYTDRVRREKPNLLKELLQRQIIAAVTVEPEHFNRAAYDRLCALWHAHDAKKAATS
jgi:hypothetical protein